KGVVVEHASLANKLLGLAEDLAVGPDFRSALVIASGFDAAIEQTLLPLIGGGAAVVIPDTARESPERVWQQITDQPVSVLSCVPSYLDAVLRGVPAAAPLRQLALGGEAFTGAFRREIARHLPTTALINLYGPTEATIDAVSYAVAGDEDEIPIGRPQANYRV